MDGFNISKIILGLQNPELLLKKLKKPIDTQQPNKPSFAPEMNLPSPNTKPQQSQLNQALQNMNNITQNIQMNHIANADRSVFIKSVLGLPPNLADVLLNAQNPAKPLVGGTLGLGNINPSLLQNQNALASLFDDTAPQQPILAQNPALMMNMPVQNVAPSQDTVALFFSGMVSLPDISKLILQNSKQAIAGLIISMASASKQGMSNEQIQETLSIINSCVAMAESNNPAQTLKSLMMLYLPWLPLNDGVGFDLEITPDNTEGDPNDSKLTVLIQTKNFGNLKGVFTLTTSNSVDVLIVCSDIFPKKLLQKSLLEESTSHAMNTNIDIEEVSPKKEELNEVHETKVNLSATNEMNPYLLLMAHAFIRHTILIDNQQSLDLT